MLRVTKLSVRSLTLSGFELPEPSLLVFQHFHHCGLFGLCVCVCVFDGGSLLPCDLCFWGAVHGAY